ncbi:histidine phosphatase family protein [Patescibacteria group bacterium AH-259-L07]|nr:histidine phosphatase family protein [Patescibacteria group bacterium AH-259-L07]
MKKYQTSYVKIKPKIRGPYTSIYLTRHCHVDYLAKTKLNDVDIPLSNIGRKQRAYLNKKLLSLSIDEIYASELARAQQTAEIFAKKINKKIIIDKRLNEINWSRWYKIKYFNMSEENRIKKFKYYHRTDERLNKIQVNARHLIRDIYLQNKGKKIVLFSHGNLIRALITSILDVDIIGFLSMEIYQSSVSKIVIDKGGYIKINYINSICHLPRRPNENLFLHAISD